MIPESRSLQKTEKDGNIEGHNLCVTYIVSVDKWGRPHFFIHLLGLNGARAPIRSKSGDRKKDEERIYPGIQ